MIAEAALDWPAVVAVKGGIIRGLSVLVPAMLLAGFCGRVLASGRGCRLTAAKAARMKLLAANGVLVMIPAALFLDAKASAGEADAAFYAVQAVELAVGAVQAGLMLLNIRDGLRMRYAAASLSKA